MLKIDQFKELTEKEVNLAYHTPALVTVLVAAADNDIDEKETEWAKKVMNYRQSIGDETLFEYYELADNSFETMLQSLISRKEGNQERLAHITAELSKLNDILKKIDRDYARKLVKSWRSLAQQIAKADGGFLGFGSVSHQEEDLMNLSMIEDF